MDRKGERGRRNKDGGEEKEGKIHHCWRGKKRGKRGREEEGGIGI